MERKKVKENYSDWSHENLVNRVKQLEAELEKKRTSSPAQIEKRSWKKPRTEREFDPSKYSTRLIALKLAYLGKRYNGLEHHTGHATPLPTIEEELWKALNKARLIFPKVSNHLQPGEVNWEGCEYSKCGRTDKGVSAFGQVVGIRVRSNRPLAKPKKIAQDVADPMEIEDFHNTHPRKNAVESASPPLSPSRLKEQRSSELLVDDYDYEETLNFDPIADEIPYPSLLNKLLPPDIRVLAWCPSPPLDFSARFSCRERQYRYFFTQPAFAPIPGSLEHHGKSAARHKDGWLDIKAMREAAKQYIGVHDFRNFCKVDPSKQNFNYERRIFHADIEEVDGSTSLFSFVNQEDFRPDVSIRNDEVQKAPKVYTFTLHGSAFLWHQVRHMVAILFLVGQGLEPPSIVSELLDVEKNPRRPTYEMASDTPLVLWDCIFPREDDPERKDVLEWVYIGDGQGNGDSKFGAMGVMDDLWEVWRERKIDEVLAASLIDVVAKQGVKTTELTAPSSRKAAKSQKLFDGGDTPRLQGTYLPVMKKPRLETIEVINGKYAARKGLENSQGAKE
ncbi:pseudouridine synthase [Xylogone sp. PMI_703]|nr:pseudouridine synthase [Xylogone sp. PMI_703]